MMVKQMEKYQTGSVTLKTMHENLLGLYESTDLPNEAKEFSNLFHQYWDQIEEIIAIKKTKQYLEEINNVIIPGFKQKILDLIKA